MKLLGLYTPDFQGCDVIVKCSCSGWTTPLSQEHFDSWMYALIHLGSIKCLKTFFVVKNPFDTLAFSTVAEMF